jgi:hypothetical protein
MSEPRQYRLLEADGAFYFSPTPGLFGGYAREHIYGLLNCPSALRALARGGYAKYRVFFANEDVALACGYRPCGVCLAERYREWKKQQLSPGQQKS